MSRDMKKNQGVFRVYFVSETAQVERAQKWTSVSPWFKAGSGHPLEGKTDNTENRKAKATITHGQIGTNMLGLAVG